MVSTVASQQKGPGFKARPSKVLSVWSFHVLPVFVWVSAECSSFLQPSKTCMFGLILLSRYWQKNWSWSLGAALPLLLVCVCVCRGWVKCRRSISPQGSIKYFFFISSSPTVSQHCLDACKKHIWCTFLHCIGTNTSNFL